MQDPAQFAAALLQAGTPAYAASAARRLVERFGREGFAFEPWRQGLAARLRDLCAALSDESPALFAEQMCWNRTAYDAREVPTERLRDELKALREVFEEELPEPARVAVAEYLDVADDALERAAADHADPERLDAGTPEGRLALRYVTTLLEGDRREALRLVVETVRTGTLAPDRLILDVLLPAQRELGLMWHANEIGAAEEHFVTLTSQSAMDRAMTYADIAEPVGKTVVVAAATGDVHNIGLQVAAHLLEMDGWRVVLLGADLPSSEVVSAVRHFEPDLLVLGATLGWQRAAAGLVIEEVRKVREVKVLVGGPAFQHGGTLWRRTAADGYAETLAETVPVARKLVGLPPR